MAISAHAIAWKRICEAFPGNAWLADAELRARNAVGGRDRHKRAITLLMRELKWEPESCHFTSASGTPRGDWSENMRLRFIENNLSPDGLDAFVASAIGTTTIESLRVESAVPPSSIPIASKPAAWASW